VLEAAQVDRRGIGVDEVAVRLPGEIHALAGQCLPQARHITVQRPLRTLLP